MLLKTEEIVAEIERRASALGLSISEISTRANLARSTFQRWKAGETDPTTPALRKIYEVLEGAEARVAERGVL